MSLTLVNDSRCALFNCGAFLIKHTVDILDSWLTNDISRIIISHLNIDINSYIPKDEMISNVINDALFTLLLQHFGSYLVDFVIQYLQMDKYPSKIIPIKYNYKHLLIEYFPLDVANLIQRMTLFDPTLLTSDALIESDNFSFIGYPITLDFVLPFGYWQVYWSLQSDDDPCQESWISGIRCMKGSDLYVCCTHPNINNAISAIMQVFKPTIVSVTYQCINTSTSGPTKVNMKYQLNIYRIA